MEIQGLTSREIQQRIFEEIGNGTNVVALKQELKEKGVPVEGYYFTTEAQYQSEKSFSAEPASAASSVSGKQVFWTILTIVIVIFKIARCSSRM